MKLPDFQTGPVQRVGGVEEARGALMELGHQQARAWNAGAQLSTAVEDWGMEMARGTSQVQHMEAIADVAIADARAKRENDSKVLWSKDEVAQLYGGEGSIPDSIKQAVGGLDETVTDLKTGEQTVRGRQDIPAWAVNPERYKMVMDKAVKDAADKISLPAWRDNFLQEAQKSVNLEYEQHKTQAVKEFYDWKNAKGEILALKLVGEGQFDAAANVAKFLDIPEAARTKFQQQLDFEKAKYQVNEPQVRGDIVGMQNMVAGLRSGETKFAYVNGQGDVKQVDVSAFPEQKRREIVNETERWMKTAGDTDRLQQERAERKLNDRMTFDFFGMVDHGNLQGAKQMLLDPPNGMTGQTRASLTKYLEGRIKKAEGNPNKARMALATSTIMEARDRAIDGSEETNPVIDPVSRQPIKFTDIDPYEEYRKGNISEPNMRRIAKDQQDLKDGTALTPRNKDVKDAETLISSTLAFKPDDTDVTKQEAKQMLLSTFRADLAQEEKTRNKKMNRDEVLGYAQSWAARGHKDESVFLGLGHNMVSAPALADVPPAYYVPLQKIRAAYLSDVDKNTGKPLYKSDAASLGRIYHDRLEPLVPLVQDAWRQTKEGDNYLGPLDTLQFAAAVDRNKEAIKQLLFNQYNIKNPTDKDAVMYEFQRKGLLKKAAFSER